MVVTGFYWPWRVIHARSSMKAVEMGYSSSVDVVIFAWLVVVEVVPRIEDCRHIWDFLSQTWPKLVARRTFS